MPRTDVWLLLTGTADALHEAVEVSPGDVVLKDRGAHLGVGRVINDRCDVIWIDDVEVDLLPDSQLADEEGWFAPVRRIENAPALFAALERIGRQPTPGRRA